VSLVAQVVDLKVRSNYDRSHGGIAVESEEALSLHSNSLSYFKTTTILFGHHYRSSLLCVRFDFIWFETQFHLQFVLSS